MKDYTNVIYDRETGKVLAVDNNGEWILHSSCELAHFENGVEPMFTDVNGVLFLKPNTIVIHGVPK